MDISILLFIILILLIYTIYLHFQIHFKSKEINDIRIKLSQIDKFWDKSYVIDYIKTLIDTKSLEFHNKCGDFTGWIEHSLKDKKLSKEFKKIENRNLKAKN